MTKAAVVILFGVWLVSLPLLSYVRAETWTDEEALWASAAWWAPAKLRPSVELGGVHFAAGRSDLAVRDFQHALALWERGRPAFERPGCEIARENLARALEVRGQFQEAAIWSGYPCVSR